MANSDDFYRVECLEDNFTGDFETQLNALYEKGWEIISVNLRHQWKESSSKSLTDQYTVIFKRKFSLE